MNKTTIKAVILSKNISTKQMIMRLLFNNIHNKITEQVSRQNERFDLFLPNSLKLTEITIFALTLVCSVYKKNSTAVSQSESSNLVMYTAVSKNIALVIHDARSMFHSPRGVMGASLV